MAVASSRSSITIPCSDSRVFCATCPFASIDKALQIPCKRTALRASDAACSVLAWTITTTLSGFQGFFFATRVSAPFAGFNPAVEPANERIVRTERKKGRPVDIRIFDRVGLPLLRAPLLPCSNCSCVYLSAGHGRNENRLFLGQQFCEKRRCLGIRQPPGNIILWIDHHR